MRLAARRARAAAGLRRRPDHRRADGERHRAGRGAPRAARARGLGRRGAGAERLAATARVRRRGGARDAVARAAAARDRARAGRGRARPTTRARCAPTRSRLDGPAIVCAQAGNVEQRRVRPAAPRSPRRRASTARGCTSTARSACGRRPARRSRTSPRAPADADSWATDGHKWLNVPYDCGVVAVRDREAHAAAMGMSAAYLDPRRVRALELRLGARGVAARARVRRLRGAALARPRRGRGAGRAQLRARAAAGGAGRGRGRRGAQRRRAQPGAARRRGGRHRPRAGGRRAVGRRHGAGTAARRCASRSRTGRPPRPTSTAAPTRSSARTCERAA